jgi:dinuclear metal center YbgI/SA1388 family protein
LNTFDLTKHLDELLRTQEIPDSSLNGLQVANSGKVTKVGLAVDGSLKAFQECKKRGIDFLVVHHGLFWGKPFALVGHKYDRIKTLIENDVALYAAHLPLDMHPKLGNNARAMVVLGWEPSGDFGDWKGITLGQEVRFDPPKPLEEIVSHVAKTFDTLPIVWEHGPRQIRTLGYISGYAIDVYKEAVDKGYDLMITGEPSHSYYWGIAESNLNMIFAGHYATERLGVLAVGEHLKERFGLETEFIELPTGH